MNNEKNPVGRPRVLSKNDIEKWKKEHGVQFDDPKAIKFVQNILQKGLINNSEVLAVHLLYNSVKSRINACKYGNGVYVNVSCEWDDPEVTTLDIITKKPNMYSEWVTQTTYYEQTNDDRDRPTIDRINEKLGYFLGNIQMLSLVDNAHKATCKPHYVFEITNIENSPETIGYFKKYATKREAINSLGIKIDTDTGRIYKANGKTYLIQSADITEGRKEFEEYEFENENDWYRGRLPVAIIEDDLSRSRIIIWKEFIFPYLSISLPKEEKTEGASPEKLDEPT